MSKDKKKNKEKKKDKSVVFFSIADEKNQMYLEMMHNSLTKFHPDVNFLAITGDLLKSNLSQDPAFFYRATPLVAKDLIKKYDVVVKIDADSVVTGDLAHTWEGDWDVGVVNNNSPKDYNEHLEKTGQALTVWNIHPLSYLNCGYVVMQDEDFIDHWIALCGSNHFKFYPFKEQDLLNIMVFYGMYKAKFLDQGDKWHGLISKGYWNKMELREDEDHPTGKRLWLPEGEEWPKEEDKDIRAIHWGGGNEDSKMNFDIKFKEPVARWLKNLTKEPKSSGD